MLALLFMGALNWAKTASTANSFLAAESLAAHTRNPLPLLEKSGFAQKDTSGASVEVKGMEDFPLTQGIFLARLMTQ